MTHVFPPPPSTTATTEPLPGTIGLEGDTAPSDSKAKAMLIAAGYDQMTARRLVVEFRAEVERGLAWRDSLDRLMRELPLGATRARKVQTRGWRVAS